MFLLIFFEDFFSEGKSEKWAKSSKVELN